VSEHLKGKKAQGRLTAPAVVQAHGQLSIRPIDPKL
jgi:hypothetical protein